MKFLGLLFLQIINLYAEIYYYLEHIGKSKNIDIFILYCTQEYTEVSLLSRLTGKRKFNLLYVQILIANLEVEIIYQQGNDEDYVSRDKGVYFTYAEQNFRVLDYSSPKIYSNDIFVRSYGNERMNYQHPSSNSITNFDVTFRVKHYEGDYYVTSDYFILTRPILNQNRLSKLSKENIAMFRELLFQIPNLQMNLRMINEEFGLFDTFRGRENFYMTKFKRVIKEMNFHNEEQILQLSEHIFQ